MIIYSFGQRIKNFVKVKIIAPTKDFFKSSKEFKYRPAGDFDGKDGILRKYYDNGVLQSEFIYKDGKLNGLCRTFYENGSIKSRENYRDDKLDGLSKVYYENGKLMADIFYREGKKIYETYYDEKGRIIKQKNY
jgi:antitoxin component YwqK of YwqJK toxin-antitoxin module